MTRLALLLLCVLGTACLADTLHGMVIKVSDGDTLTVLDAQHAQHRIRLNGIDAPESHQAFGQRARQALDQLVYRKNVLVLFESRDRYGRILGEVRVGDLNVNLEMVRLGMAWHYAHYAPKRLDLAQAQAQARSARLGLWADKHPVPPWEYRSRKREEQAETTAQTTETKK